MKRFVLLLIAAFLGIIVLSCSITGILPDRQVSQINAGKAAQDAANSTGKNRFPAQGASYAPGVSPLPEKGQVPDQNTPPALSPSPGTSPAHVVSTGKKDVKVPILYYHAISDHPFGIEELFVSPGMFEKHLAYLKANGYTPIHFEQLENLESIEKPVILSFDDGYRDNYTEMYPILKKYGFKAVIFQIMDMVGQENYLTREQILEMRELVSFQNHTMTHRELIYLDDASVEKEMTQATKLLEELTGQKVSTISYPIGLYNNKVKETTKKYFKYAVTTDPGLYKPGEDKHQIPRIYMQRSDTFEKFVNKLKGLED